MIRSARRMLSARFASVGSVTSIQRAAQKPHRSCAAMANGSPRVVVRWPGGAESLVINIETEKANKILNRDPQEPLHKALTRLQTSLAGKKNKKKKAQKKGNSKDLQEAAAADSGGPQIQLLQCASSQQPVDPETPNSLAWRPPAALSVGQELVTITYNPPTVTSLELPTRLLPGFPVLAHAQVQYADESACEWQWLRLPPSKAGESSNGAASVEPVELACSGPVYVPVAEDAGCKLAVRCTPVATAAAATDGADTSHVKDAVEVEAPLEGTVGCFPAQLPEASGKAFRVVTYNILAEQYTAQEYAQKVIFAHVPEALLDVHWRKQKVLREVINSNSDIVCLQEVDVKVYEKYLKPLMQRRGFDGWFANKAGQVSEGSAMFYRTSLFTLIAKKRLNLPELFKPPLPPSLQHFTPLLDASPHLTSALQSVTTIAQASLLVPKGRLAASLGCAARPLVIANTHLFFHHDASHIRTMHVAAILREAQELARGHAAPAAAAAAEAAAPQALLRPAVLFCGDLNSDMNDGTPGTVQLLSTGSLASDYWDWSAGARFSFETGRDDDARAAALAAASEEPSNERSKDTPQPPPQNVQGVDADCEEANATKTIHTAPMPHVTGVDLSLPQTFNSTHPLDAGIFTNYVPGYQGLLDYIWVDAQAMHVVHAHPVPPVDTLGGYVPNARHASDHLPVVADVELLDSENAVADREKEATSVPATGAAADAAIQYREQSQPSQVQQTGDSTSALQVQGGVMPASKRRCSDGMNSAGVNNSVNTQQAAFVRSVNEPRMAPIRCGFAAAAALPRTHADPFNSANTCAATVREVSPSSHEHSFMMGYDAHTHSQSHSQISRIRGSFLEGDEDAGDAGNAMHGEHDGKVVRATDEHVAAAAQCIQDGGVVALPTDTLYGLAALGMADDAIQRIYEVKGRDAKVPLAVCVASVDQVELCGSCQNLPEGLLHALLPGPVTVVLERRTSAPLSRYLNPDLTGVAIRVPAHGFIQKVVHAVGGPIVLTSANRSGEASTTKIEQFLELWNLVDGVFDGGEILSDGKGSTIVDLQRCGEGVFKVMRDGSALEATSSTLENFGLKRET